MNHTWIIDIVVSGNSRTGEKESERGEKYHDLAREIQRLWKTPAIVIQIVIEALWAVAWLVYEHVGYGKEGSG